jgi:hypothetical protein
VGNEIKAEAGKFMATAFKDADGVIAWISLSAGEPSTEEFHAATLQNKKGSEAQEEHLAAT